MKSEFVAQKLHSREHDLLNGFHKITCVLMPDIRVCCFPVCENGKVQVAEILIAHGAKLNAVDFNSFTPLHCAVSSVSVFAAMTRHLALGLCS